MRKYIKALKKEHLTTFGMGLIGAITAHGVGICLHCLIRFAADVVVVLVTEVLKK